MTAPRRVRLLALLTALLQFLGAGAVPLADAFAERAARGVQAHVESRDADGCPAAHDHLACALCRVIVAGAGELPPPPFAVAVAAVPSRVSAPAVAAVPTVERGAPGARAPPLG